MDNKLRLTDKVHGNPTLQLPEVKGSAADVLLQGNRTLSEVLTSSCLNGLKLPNNREVILLLWLISVHYNIYSVSSWFLICNCVILLAVSDVVLYLFK